MREGICRGARFLLEDFIDGEFSAGGGGGVSRAGESCGDNNELMSIAPFSSFRLDFPHCSPYIHTLLHVPNQLKVLFLFSFFLRRQMRLVASAVALLQGPLWIKSEAEEPHDGQHGTRAGFATQRLSSGLGGFKGERRARGGKRADVKESRQAWTKNQHVKLRPAMRVQRPS